MKKRNLYLFIISTITIACIIAGTYIHFNRNFNDKEIDFNSVIYFDELDDFHSISIDANILAITVEQTADSIGEIKVHYNKERLKPSIYVKDSKLYIEQNIPGNLNGNNNCYVKIFIPKTMKLKDTYMKVNVGELIINNISSESFNIKTNVGEINLNKANFQKFEGKSNVGEIKITTTNNLDDYNMNVESNVGEISIKSRNFKNKYNQKGYSDKFIKAKTNVGEVVIFQDDYIGSSTERDEFIEEKDW